MPFVRRALTHYDVLDVDPRADTERIHAAWRHMASLVHPDAALVNSDPEEYADREIMMKTVNAAWEVLGDVPARAQYDADIGLERRSIRALLRLRRGARAAGRSRANEPLHVHRAPLLSRPPLLAELQALLHFVWSTRLGQWLLLLSALALAELTSAGLVAIVRGPLLLTLASLFALVLAWGGEPTPAADATHAGYAAARLGYRWTKQLARATGRELLSLLVATISASRTPPADES